MSSNVEEHTLNMASSEDMTINIKTTKGAKDQVTVSGTATVKQLKEAIAEKLPGSPVECQRLIYKGRVMKDDKECTFYGKFSIFFFRIIVHF